MLINKDLPNSKINSKPFSFKLIKHDSYDLYSDGSIAKTVKVTNKSLPKIIGMIDRSGFGTQIQVYRTNETDLYVSVLLEIEYNLKMPWKGIGKSKSKVLAQTTEKTQNALKKIDSILSFPHSRHMYDQTELHKNLYVSIEPLSNLSLIKTGKNRVSTIVSINNIACLKLNEFFKKDSNTMTVISLIKPSIEHNQKISETTTQNVKLISGINRKADTDTVRKVHTIDTKAEDTLLKYLNDNWFINVSIVIHSDDYGRLKAKSDSLKKEFIKRGIILYHHTNSTFNQYMSLFNGQAAFGEHFHICLSGFAKRVLFTWMTY